MSFGKHRPKISPNILFYKSQNITYVHFRPNDWFLYAKRQIKLEIFPPLFALNYLQIIICKLFANKNYSQINLPSVVVYNAPYQCTLGKKESYTDRVY